LLPTDAENITESITIAVAYLLAGKVIAFPTEMVYGLGARCDDAARIASIFRIKKRPSDNPLIAHIATVDDIPRLANTLTPIAKILIECFFPGPLTVVLPRRASIPAIVSARLDTIAIRMPANPIAQRLITAVGAPLVAPSANR
jgi:L-threonylcarbamoyladenylate synthase